MAKITFNNKVDLTVKPIPEINKVTADNINEIKTVVNGLDDDKLDKGNYIGTAEDLKNYIDNQVSLFAFPNPYFSSVSPLFGQPNTTFDIDIYGSYFRENMNVSVGGCIVNSIRFITGTHIRVNITTSVNEGIYDITLNNGIETIAENAFEINLGSVYRPILADAINVTGSIDADNLGEIKVATLDTQGTLEIDPTKFKISPNEDYTVEFNLGISEFDQDPYVNIDGYNREVVQLITTTGVVRYAIGIGGFGTMNPTTGASSSVYRFYDAALSSETLHEQFTWTNHSNYLLSQSNITKKFAIKRLNGSVGFYYDNTLIVAANNQVNEELKLKFQVTNLDFINIRAIIHP